MTYYIKSGSIYRVYKEDSLDVKETLPSGTYTIVQCPMTSELMLDKIKDFSLPKKLYGNIEKNSHRILNTFNLRKNNTGVLLSGEKGSGKTLLAKLISIDAKKSDVPTIIIDKNWKGEKFNQLIQNINQPCIIIFDEFEKVYDRDEQDQILTLLDGVYQTKKLFLLTCNDFYRVNEYMLNRPGRIFYHLDFDGLDSEFISQYCDDNLLNKDFKSRVSKISGLFDKFNFDLLSSIVEECNRYNEDPFDVIEILNARPQSSKFGKFDFEIYYQGKKIDRRYVSEPYDYVLRNLNPFNGVSVSFTLNGEKERTKNRSKNRTYPEPYTDSSGCVASSDSDDEDDMEIVFYEFKTSELVEIDQNAGKFIYNNGEIKLILIKEKPPEYMFRHLL